MARQVVVGGSLDSVPSTTTTEYASMFAGEGSNWTTNSQTFRQEIPTYGNISNFRMKLTVAPGIGKSWTFTVMKNQIPTFIVITISDTATTGQDIGHSLPVAPDDSIQLRSVPSGTPASTRVRWTWLFDGTIPKETILLGNNPNNNNQGNIFYPVAGTAPLAAVEFYAEQIMPTSGTIKKFYVGTLIAPGAGDSITFTIRKNGVDTTLAVTISGATDKEGNNIIDEVNVVAGDTIAIKFTKVGSISFTRYRWGIVFEPDTDGEFILPMASSDLSKVTFSGEYVGIITGNTFYSSTEVFHQQLAQKMTIKKIYVELDTPPGSFGSRQHKWIHTLRKNGSSTALTCTVSGNATTCNSAVDVSIADDDLLSTLITNTQCLFLDGESCPALNRKHISYLAFIEPIRKVDIGTHF